MNVIESKDLLKIYTLGDNEIRAVDGVSLDIREGEYLSIIGKSGSGKSTLMHMLGLLDTPTSGSIKLEGKEVSNYDEAKLAKLRNQKIGFVFQTFNLLAKTTTLENVILPLRYSDTPREKWEEKAKEVLDIVGLSHRLENKSNELSGGQKQRVAIARALVNEPSIIFADEPTGNLDTKTGDEIVDLFTKLHAQGRTIVVVTHDSDLAKVAERIVTIKDGKLI